MKVKTRNTGLCLMLGTVMMLTEVHTASREMAEGNKAILEEVQKLQNATDMMQASMEEMAEGAKKISETGNSLNDIANNMDKSIQAIGDQVDLFNI